MLRAKPAAVAAAVLVAMLCGSAVAVAWHGQRVYVASNACSGHAYRPSRIIIACATGQFYADHLAYSSYGGRIATARDLLKLDDCRPNCAQGQFRSYPGTVTLMGIVRCSDGRLYYSRIRSRFTGTYPGGPRSYTESIEPFIHCGAVIARAVASGPRASPAKSCGSEHIYRITGMINATGTSCAKAHAVFRTVERAPLPNNVASTPYFRFSPPYTVPTPYGRFTCRREPHGLGGSEHTIRCRHGRARVNWDTVHD